MTNLSNSPETVKINATIVESRRVEKEITVPYYFRDEYGSACNLCCKTHYIGVRTGFYYQIEAMPADKFIERIAKGTPITKDEFESELQRAKDYIEAMLIDPSNEPDENEAVEMAIQDRIDQNQNY